MRLLVATSPRAPIGTPASESLPGCRSSRSTARARRSCPECRATAAAPTFAAASERPGGMSRWSSTSGPRPARVPPSTSAHDQQTATPPSTPAGGRGLRPDDRAHLVQVRSSSSACVSCSGRYDSPRRVHATRSALGAMAAVGSSCRSVRWLTTSSRSVGRSASRSCARTAICLASVLPRWCTATPEG